MFIVPFSHSALLLYHRYPVDSVFPATTQKSWSRILINRWIGEVKRILHYTWGVNRTNIDLKPVFLMLYARKSRVFLLAAQTNTSFLKKDAFYSFFGVIVVSINYYIMEILTQCPFYDILKLKLNKYLLKTSTFFIKFKFSKQLHTTSSIFKHFSVRLFVILFGKYWKQFVFIRWN